MIYFKVDKLYGGYAPVLAYYNENKPESAQLLCEANVAEGGFEIKLNAEELAARMEYLRDRDRMSDYNDTVRQLRFSGENCLRSLPWYAGFTREETALLLRALQHSLGAGNVSMDKVTMDKVTMDKVTMDKVTMDKVIKYNYNINTIITS